jgi:hypothetical protein
VATLQQQVLSQSRLQPVVERLYPGTSQQRVSEIIDDIRSNMTVLPIVTDLSQIGTSATKEKPSSPVPGFNVNYTASNPHEAQQICNELTSLLVDENMKKVQAAAMATNVVLDRGLKDEREALKELGVRVATLKRQHPTPEMQEE